MHTKYEGKFVMAISNFAQALATFALNCDNKLTTKWIRDTSSNVLHAPKPDT